MRILINMEIQEADDPQEEIIIVYPSGDGVTNDKYECNSRFDLIKKLLRAIKQERENAKVNQDPTKGA